MFTGDQFPPRIKLIIQCQERKDKIYTIHEKIQLFENETRYEYFKWWDYFKKIIKADDLADKISKKILRKDLTLIKSFTGWFTELLTKPENSKII